MILEPSSEDPLSSEFRWPRKGDRPFTPATRWQDSATFEKDQHGRMVMMMMTGYKRGADLMVQRATADQFDLASLVYPILFNYRQFIELSLKYLISTYGRTVGVEPSWRTHDLRTLWEVFEKLLDAYGGNDRKEADRIVADIIAEFAKIDPGSFSFRYPVDKKGNPIPLAVDQLDLANLADVMQAVDSFFNGCDGYLDALAGAGL